MHRRKFILDAPEISTWPSAIADNLAPDKKERFDVLKTAMQQYFDFVPLPEIQSNTGVSKSELSRLARKCLEVAEDGRIFGFRALIPHARVKSYNRVADEAPKRQEQQGGQSGLLLALLVKYPDIEEQLVKELLQRSKKTDVKPQQIRAKDLHRIFITLLKSKKDSEKYWPFTTKHLGIRSISQYMKSILDKNFTRSVHIWGSREAKAHLNVGTGHGTFLVYEDPYDAVEIDAHHIDCHSTASFKTPDGGESEILLERLWLIAVVERRSSAVLAYTVVYRSEVGTDDVLRTIRKAITEKWIPRTDLPAGYQYGDGAGLPSGMFDACHGAVWSVTLLDGALAHLSKALTERARKALGFVMNWGPVGHFERRPNVERTFKQIETEVFHRMPATTGSNPYNGRAENAEKKAIDLQIRAEELEGIIDVYFAQHNATPTEGQYNKSPLEVLAYFLGGPLHRCSPRTLSISSFESAKTLASREPAFIRGGRKTGRRPYVQVDRVKYTSPLLRDSIHLVGTRVTVDIDEDDMRQVKVYLSNGQELGYLQAEGMWSVTKHSRVTRKAINSLLSKKILVITKFVDPVKAYFAYLSTPKSEKRSATGRPLTRRQATDAVRVAREAGIERTIGEISKPVSKEKTVKRVASILTLVGAPINIPKNVRNRR